MMRSIQDIRTIAVIGAGTMGAGIAQMAAAAGFSTLLYDIEEAATQKGISMIGKNLAGAIEKGKLTEQEKETILARIKPTTLFSDLVADVFIEAAIEKKEIKQQIFQRLASQNAADAVFTSNTSSIPITTLADGIPSPDRVAGMHFFNPAHLMKLVEVVSGEKTSTETAQLVFDLCLAMKKEPVMAKDYPGFIVNRIGKLYHTEPLKILEEGIADVKTIDELMEASGFKMGPFRLIDLIGVDANLNVTKSLYELTGHEEKFKPSALQQDLVNKGLFGKKSGKGFYSY